MKSFSRVLSIAAVCLMPAPALLAQTAVEVSGHWAGSVLAPGMDVSIELDLAKNGGGQLTGTFGQPGQHISGLPLTNFGIDGRSITFQIKGGVPGRRAFNGDVAADGTSITGDYASEFGTVPFSVTRTGDARIDPPSKSAPIARQFEGVWNAVLDVDGGLHVVMSLVNRPDGTSTGYVLNIEEGLELPITAMAQSASQITVELKGVGAEFAGGLNADGTELAGTFSQGPLSLPLTFHHAVSGDGKK
jgi:hypothetical protein